MGDNAVFISLGDDGGYVQALLRAYQSIGGAKAIVMREEKIPKFDLDKMKTRLPGISDMEDVLFDIHDLEDEELLKMENNISSLNLEAIDSLKDNTEAEAENGAALLIASKEIQMNSLWNQEIEFKPYFLYYAIAGLSCLERNGTMILKIYDINTKFTKTLIYILSCNFTAIKIVHPYSLNNFTSERYLICQGMLHKDTRSNEILGKLKSIYKSLKSMHLSKNKDLDTLLTEEDLKA